MTTTSQKLDIVRETPCQILQSDVLSEKAAATSISYIPTLRIKEWKPVDSINIAKIKENKKYCYLDNDRSHEGINNLGDYPCNLSTFNNVPFITDAFQDDRQQTTSTLATNKCVIEIDSGAVSSDSLNSFWGGISSNECTSQFANIVKQNNDLKVSISTLSTQLSQLLEEKAKNEVIIQDLNANISSYIKPINDSIQDNSDLQLQIDGANDKKYQLSNQFNEKLYECTTSLASYTDQLNVCSSKLTNISNDLSYATSNLSFSNTVYEKKQVEYATLLLAYSNIVNQTQDLRHETTVLNQNLNQVMSQLKDCQANSSTCHMSLTQCKTDDAIAVEETAKVITYWTACKSNLNECKSDLDICQANLPLIKVALQKKIDTYETCESLLTVCTGSQAELRIRDSALSNDINLWMGSHYNCTPCNVTIDGLKESIAQILIWCKFPLQAQNDLQNKTIEVQQAQTTAATNLVEVCEAGNNTLPTTIPTPTQPVGSSAVPDKGNRGPPPPPTASPTPTCTVVLTPIQCDGNGIAWGNSDECYSDDNVYIIFDQGIHYNRNQDANNGDGDGEAKDIGPTHVTISITDYVQLSMDTIITKWALDQQRSNRPDYKYGSWNSKVTNWGPKWTKYYLDQYHQEKFKIWAPYVFTSSGPGKEVISRLFAKEGYIYNEKGEKSEHQAGVLHVIPNNGAYCMASVYNQSLGNGYLDAINHIPVGASVTPSANAGLRGGDNRWHMNMAQYIESIFVYTAPTCSFSNITGGIDRNDIDPCNSSFVSSQKPMQLPLNQPGHHIQYHWGANV